MKEIPVGPRLDAAVAEALGWTAEIGSLHGHPCVYWRGAPTEVLKEAICDCPVWSPSTEIAAAWELIETIREAGAQLDSLGFTGEEWRCILGKTVDDYCVGEAPTAPEAICRAFLKAKESG